MLSKNFLLFRLCVKDSKTDEIMFCFVHCGMPSMFNVCSNVSYYGIVGVTCSVCTNCFCDIKILCQLE